jgi:putative Mn2+ efflux pump MntP
MASHRFMFLGQVVIQQFFYKKKRKKKKKKEEDVFMLRQLFIKPNHSGLENGGLVPYFQVVSLGLFTISMIDYRFRSK